MTDLASQFIGTIPENYDRFLGPNIFNEYAKDIAGRAAALKPSSVLEIAAGTGIVSRYLRDALAPDASLLVSDLNAPMLAVAAAKFAESESVRFLPADAMALPFSDDEFDLVLCQFGVMFFPDIIASFREAARVIRPGGHYVFSTWGQQSDNPFSQVAHNSVAEFFPDNPPGFYNVPFFYHDADVVCADLTKAGLANVNVAEVRHQRQITDMAGFARGLVYGNPIVDEIRQRGGVDPDAVVKRVTEGLIERFGPEPATMPLKITVFTCKIP